VGLAGELRSVPAMGRRVLEAARLGARAVIVPAASDVADVDGVTLWRCESLREALQVAQPAVV
ncbi:MAG: DNA repair protein RadA, partial [Acidimicrobiales bacterium]